VTQPTVQQLMGEMCDEHRGIRGCALVDASSGLVWYAVMQEPHDGLWEAAVDYWRLHSRLSHHFEVMGELGGVAAYHRGGMLTLLPCLREPDVLLVSLADNRTVDWMSWQKYARRLGQSIRAAI
jgi:hypothetical protein